MASTLTTPFAPLEPLPDEICQVWDSNFEQELSRICAVVIRFPFIAIDAVFPGVVHIPVPDDYDTRTYRSLRANVNALPLIQLGLSFSDALGRRPFPSTWQFNFREFSTFYDESNPSIIALLRRSGINFCYNMLHGVAFVRFADFLSRSGMMSNNKVTWLAFHGNFDIGYLLKMLSRNGLPETLGEFTHLARIMFPVFYDIEVLARFFLIPGRLETVALYLGVQRSGNAHQAGSDSLLVSQCFRRMMDLYYHGGLERHRGAISGLIE